MPFLRLDYLSCLLTILSTVLVGRRMWQGWVVASANSAIICVIALRTAQVGFVPANVFCLAIYGYNIAKWRSPVSEPIVTSQNGIDRRRSNRSVCDRAHS